MRAIMHSAIRRFERHPSIAAGTGAFILAFGVVAANAIYAQPGDHPVPLWATRDGLTTRSVATQEQAGGGRLDIATKALTLENIPVPLSRPDRAQQPETETASVRAAQALLQDAGHYTGKLDGIYGPMTREAVIAFQNVVDVEPDGQVTDALIARLEQGKVDAGRATVETSAETARNVAANPPRQATEASGDEPSVERTSIEAEPLEIARIPDEPPSAVRVNGQSVFEAGIHEIRDSALIARVQIGLINFGETGITVDGVMGERTSAAIRAFQQRYGLAVTGAPDLAVIRKMEQIGALSQS